ncbi:hypothetical protein M3G11_10970, partial [Corynebacterium sanguinis]|uniref:hypothetical protein n=1 Tax=Corynebacterium sanguinis TaxID=2594913 RepID=UPI0021A345C7
MVNFYWADEDSGTGTTLKSSPPDDDSMGVVFGTEGAVSIVAEVGRAAKTGGRATDAPTKM